MQVLPTPYIYTFDNQQQMEWYSSMTMELNMMFILSS